MSNVRQPQVQLLLGPWTLHADPNATRLAYADIVQGSAVQCSCADCRNWLEQRAKVLPPAFIAAIHALGIDATKETELSEYEGGQVEADRNFYWGEYLFVGKVNSGPEAYVEQADGRGSVPALLEVFPGIHLGVSNNTKWSRLVAPFAEQSCSVLAFQVHAARGSAYA